MKKFLLFFMSVFIASLSINASGVDTIRIAPSMPLDYQYNLKAKLDTAGLGLPLTLDTIFIIEEIGGLTSQIIIDTALTHPVTKLTGEYLSTLSYGGGYKVSSVYIPINYVGLAGYLPIADFGVVPGVVVEELLIIKQYPITSGLFTPTITPAGPFDEGDKFKVGYALGGNPNDIREITVNGISQGTNIDSVQLTAHFGKTIADSVVVEIRNYKDTTRVSILYNVYQKYAIGLTYTEGESTSNLHSDTVIGTKIEISKFPVQLFVKDNFAFVNPSTTIGTKRWYHNNRVATTPFTEEGIYTYSYILNGVTETIDFEIIQNKGIYVDVVNGTGDGYYRPGQEITINANSDQQDKYFVEWTANKGGFKNYKNRSTIYTVPSTTDNIVITANYGDYPRYVINTKGAQSLTAYNPDVIYLNYTSITQYGTIKVNPGDSLISVNKIIRDSLCNYYTPIKNYLIPYTWVNSYGDAFTVIFEISENTTGIDIVGEQDYVYNGQIYSVTGQLIKSGVKGEKELIKRTSNLPYGIYILSDKGKAEKFAVTKR
jgi:hypothetical protein